MTTEYGRKHIDGSRSGGQPVTDDAASETGKKMNDINAKALALVNALGSAGIQTTNLNRNDIFHEALYRAIEQHEAYKQKVSDAVVDAEEKYGAVIRDNFGQFIIPAPKPDPLVEAWIEATGNTVGMEPLRAALDARGLEIRSKNDDQC